MPSLALPELTLRFGFRVQGLGFRDPRPYTLHSKTQSINPKSKIPNPKPQSLTLLPQLPNPKSKPHLIV
jgi:hypothetical protein